MNVLKSTYVEISKNSGSKSVEMEIFFNPFQRTSAEKCVEIVEIRWNPMLKYVEIMMNWNSGLKYVEMDRNSWLKYVKMNWNSQLK